ncbi:U3 small nucleolar RNA-associated 11 [Hyphodiscus hymeniophilus]|uniref:U3 small nucleolar RNA-associated protein 11 n=1 Tax=Hyphodiscus hymeniophilus TaxID=353542 RepID=A0A9P7AZ42_9HELO|nr:U3 small nucleolar RNA-associated 11 [Hyphodiscus hymeniophilus]
MSSMRNAVQRRNHRERGQPEERKKWGLLEKHKDYSARARDFNAKKTKLKALRQKVLDKNPDEFYFSMTNKKGPTTGKKGTGTIKGDRGNAVLGQDAVRLFKTQDLGYVRTMRNKTQREVDDLERRVTGIRGHGQKIVFVEDEGEQHGRMDADEDMDEESDDEDHEGDVDLAAKKLRKLHEKEADKLESKLTVARQRLKALAEAEEALDLQRARMAKSPAVGGVNKNGMKFKVRERKR